MDEIKITDINQKPNMKSSEKVPSWVKLPEGFSIPKGAQVIFVRFRANWTTIPSKGDQVAVLWTLSIKEESLAMKRSAGDMLRGIDELAKQMVRVINGKNTDWSGTDPDADIDLWWDEVGPKCRNMLHRVYTQLHNLTDQETDDFFENCVVVKTAV